MKFQRMREGVFVDCTFEELIEDSQRFQHLSDSKSWLIGHLGRTLQMVEAERRSLEEKADIQEVLVKYGYGSAADTMAERVLIVCMDKEKISDLLGVQNERCRKLEEENAKLTKYSDDLVAEIGKMIRQFEGNNRNGNQTEG